MFLRKMLSLATLAATATSRAVGPASVQCHEEHDRIALDADPRTAR